ncbi:unnamed protein product [Darwinula stevensoni]|uniref:Uncharacterized protein n=1 Tax=Darwinula stevensoni TaxID=69355 RepID=A0A7R8XF79_9CRUS|nr:unnamed protein product [Darwinula stevensoni]CAG0890430.1 unnamed protein product [Darwinula stevensoni]
MVAPIIPKLHVLVQIVFMESANDLGMIRKTYFHLFHFFDFLIFSLQQVFWLNPRSSGTIKAGFDLFSGIGQAEAGDIRSCNPALLTAADGSLRFQVKPDLVWYIYVRHSVYSNSSQMALNSAQPQHMAKNNKCMEEENSSKEEMIGMKGKGDSFDFFSDPGKTEAEDRSCNPELSMVIGSLRFIGAAEVDPNGRPRSNNNLKPSPPKPLRKAFYPVSQEHALFGGGSILSQHVLTSRYISPSMMLYSTPGASADNGGGAERSRQQNISQPSSSSMEPIEQSQDIPGLLKKLLYVVQDINKKVAVQGTTLADVQLSVKKMIPPCNELQLPVQFPLDTLSSLEIMEDFLSHPANVNALVQLLKFLMDFIAGGEVNTPSMDLELDMELIQQTETLESHAPKEDCSWTSCNAGIFMLGAVLLLPCYDWHCLAKGSSQPPHYLMNPLDYYVGLLLEIEVCSRPRTSVEWLSRSLLRA